MADETITLQQYVNAARQTFLTVALLPDQNHSLEITPEGCLFLLTWTKCFTEAFSKGKSWNGDFTLADFKVCRGHVQKHKKPKKFGDEGMKNDMEKFVEEIELVFRSRDSRLRFTYPPYFSDFTFRLRNLEIIQNVLSNQYKLLLETHMCFMPSYERGCFIIGLYRNYQGGDQNDKWETAIKTAVCASGWKTKVSNVVFFKDIVTKAEEDGRTYGKTNFEAFRFSRDTNNEEEKFPDDSGIELMIPYHLGDFIARIVAKVILDGIDITDEYDLNLAS
ncbi:hypothetical protein OsI_38936 [Oryza sativa Indica Group]|uniref:Uncharacterized protein n=2 Tax=Oryza TaxID=4527 RepID=A0A0E0FDL2_9ORYZ|nr:hypothetical protein OsI_38936 [Oryza sativa Indica Group]